MSTKKKSNGLIKLLLAIAVGYFLYVMHMSAIRTGNSPFTGKPSKVEYYQQDTK